MTNAHLEAAKTIARDAGAMALEFFRDSRATLDT